MKVAAQIAAVAGVLFLSSPAWAWQSDQQEELIAKRDKKLHSEFLKQANWILDYDEARAEAAKSGKLIFAYFTRSYAHCPPCAALEAGALSDPAFPEFGKNYVLFLHITSHVETDPYQDLLQEKGGRGFPHLAFLDAEGNVVAKHEKERSTEAFAATGKSATDFMALRDKAAAGDDEAQVDFFVAAVGIGYLPLEEATKQLAELRPRMTPEQVAQVDGTILTMEVMNTLESIDSEEAMYAAGKDFTEMAAKGRVPPDSEMAAVYFWLYQFEYAANAEDVKLAEGVFDQVKTRFGSQSQYARLITALTSKLEELRNASEGESGDDVNNG